MTWWTIVVWLLRTIGPVILEYIIKWIIDQLKTNQMIAYGNAMAALPGGMMIPPKQMEKIRLLVEKYPHRVEKLLDICAREREKLADRAKAEFI